MKKLPPIVISIDHSLAEILEGIQIFSNAFFDATETVLDIMLKNNLTLDPQRRAVWTRQKTYIHADDSQFEIHYKRKAGETFPSENFAKNCQMFCEEKVARKETNFNHLTSHESRKPENMEWGGAIELLFHFITSDENVIVVHCVSASSGLKEWEDAVLELGKYKFFGLIDFKNIWTKEILCRIEESVKNDPDSRPKEKPITQYAEEVFSMIDNVNNAKVMFSNM